MTLELTVLGISAFVVLILFVLFRIEMAKGERLFLTGFRNVLDIAAQWFSEKFLGFFVHVGAGVFRTTAHYVLHHVLGFVISKLTKVQQKLFKLHQRNKSVVKHSSGEGTHLDAIAAHKAETSLTEAEKRKMKAH